MSLAYEMTHEFDLRDRLTSSTDDFDPRESPIRLTHGFNSRVRPMRMTHEDDLRDPLDPRNLAH